jgi:hypothetical protein
MESDNIMMTSTELSALNKFMFRQSSDDLLPRPDLMMLMTQMSHVLTWCPQQQSYIINDLRTYQLLKLQHGF